MKLVKMANVKLFAFKGRRIFKIKFYLYFSN